MSTSSSVPFYPGQKLQLKNNPAEYVEYTGESNKVGRNVFIKVRPLNGPIRTILADNVLPVEEGSQNALEQAVKGCFGKLEDLQLLMTFEKLRGSLNDVIYSMEAAQVDFYPHQFKPVLKFVRSPLHRLLLADEVGLGKTIESGLIWIEMQARLNAKRLLVVCPPTLAEKWEMELKEKFLVDATQVDFTGFKKKFEDFEKNGAAEEFALIATYSALRPPKSARGDLNDPADEGQELSPKVKLLNTIKFWNNPDYAPFDLVIFDEAHYMRNSGTATHMLGEALSEAARGLLCVSATPINNRSEDLHSLLSLIDEDFFASQASFTNLTEINRPTVQAATCLARHPVDFTRLRQCLKEMEENAYVQNSPLFDLLKKTVAKMEGEASPSMEAIIQAQDMAEKLNLLGGYISRTQRRQVEENRPQRVPVICPVHYAPIEKNFYAAIEKSIRTKCKKIDSEFSALALISRQLMAASCLPAYAESLLGKEPAEDCIFEIFGLQNTEDDGKSEVTPPLDMLAERIPTPDELARCDSKFSALLKLIKEYHGERIIIFAYYHATLKYLFRRLKALGMKVSMIYGETPAEERWEEIERFTSGETQIFLSSEVGSEGIDLQCSHIVVNYDMPWNPMRIEQRIGRIDRVGQKAQKLNIINFNIVDTIHQRVYERLHEKLGKVADTLGDMEEILGREIRKLTLDLFTSELTPEQELQRISQTAQAIEKKAVQMRLLDEQGAELVGHSDYLQHKIEESRKKGEYVRPDELEKYLKNFFGLYFQGTLIQPDTPAPGCLRLQLTDAARKELNAFISNDHTHLAKGLRQSPLNITFSKEVMKALPPPKKRTVNFVTHTSPLIRWITKYYTAHGHNFCRATALTASLPTLPEGCYVFNVHLWEISGISSYKRLSYGFRNLVTGETILGRLAETLFKDLLLLAKPLADQNNISPEVLRNNLETLDDALVDAFGKEVENFQAENETLYEIRKKRIENIFQPRIARDKEILASLEERKMFKTVPARKGKIRAQEQAMKQQQAALEKHHHPEPQATNIAMGIFFNNL